jgi:hypothetical protein
MTERPVFNALRTVAPEALAGVGSFLAIIAVMASNSDFAAQVAWGGLITGASSAATGGPGTYILLAAVLSALAAFDLGVLRHVYRVCATPHAGACASRRSEYPERP